MQGTRILDAESHPLNQHGFNFCTVGQGFENYAVGVPSRGCVAIRFPADNPALKIILIRT